ncbi:MAG: sulfur-oxidizing protein SoxB [Arenicella sp.]|jgi:sulfur-oxidizing protein SoxB
MIDLTRRSLFKLVGLTATGSLAAKLAPFTNGEAYAQTIADLYNLPMQGQVRIMHTTDIHAQIRPVYFREPNVNLGVGPAQGQLPHVVGEKLVKKLNLESDSLEAYAYTSVNFEQNAKKFGKMGGAAQIKTLLDNLRKQAGGKQNTLTLDGGDLWQGSATSLWTRGRDMVDISNLLEVDMLTGHWEFTYTEEELLANLVAFDGEFLSQNVRVKEDSLFEDSYFEMVEKYDGLGLYDEDAGYAFKPYSIKEVNGAKIAVIGQSFPRTANANPPGFIPDWSFGIREDDLNDLVATIRKEHAPAAVVLLSHNGMDVDIKLASEVAGIDAIFGGHTHDGIPQPIKVKTPDGKTCLVTNAGSNGKFLGVMDFDIKDGKLLGMQYQMLPIFEQLLAADKSVENYINDLRENVYDEQIVESRADAYLFNKTRVGKTYDAILNEKLAISNDLLYRRGNFMGTWDQLICDAMQAEYKSDITLSPGFRWGTTILPGQWITMDDLMTQCAMTYGETYVNQMKGSTVLGILEQVADNLFEPDPYLQSGGDMVRVGGLEYSIAPNNKLGERVTSVRLMNTGRKLDLEQTYNVSGWAVVGQHPDGRLVWDIVRDYIIANKDKDNHFTLGPVNHPDLEGVANNEGLESYAGKSN